MSVPYKVTYFEWRWLAEPIRYMLTYVGEKFDDVRVKDDGWVESEKQKHRYQKLPTLEERQKDGSVVVLSQSSAIVRYLGNKYGLVAGTPLEQQQCDEYSDCLKDIMNEAAAIAEPDAPNKEENTAKLYSTTVPRYFAEIENQLKKQKAHKNPETGVIPLVGKSLTWVDFQLAHFSDILLVLQKMLKPDAAEVLEPYPAIKEHQQAILGLPKIQEWIEKRPKRQDHNL